MVKTYQLTWDINPKPVPLVDYPSTDYFCIHILMKPATLTMVPTSTPTSTDRVPKLYYSYNKYDWIELPFMTPLSLSSHVYLKTDDQFWGGTYPATSYTLNITQPYYASGKISYFFDDPLQHGGKLQNLFNGEGNYRGTTWESTGYNLRSVEYLQLDYLQPIDYQYAHMFENCNILNNLPQFKATQLSVGCYAGMFTNCKNLSKLPTLPILDLKESCYSFMFYNCEKIKLSKTQTEECPNAYRIPISGEGSSNPYLYSYEITMNMFYGTNNGVIPDDHNDSYWGERLSAVEYYIPINTTIYTKNEIVQQQ